MSLSTAAARLRILLFWTHLTTGVAAGIVVFILSVSGALLGFEQPVIALVDGAPQVAPTRDQRRLTLDTLLARAGLTATDVASITLRADAAEPVIVRTVQRARGTLLINPYTGATIPTVGGGRARALMQDLRRWHRWLGQPNGRGWGRDVTGAANLLFLFMVVTGLYLWWPRTLTRQAFRAVVVPGLRLSGKARDFNWHHVIGLWSAVPLFVIVLGGVFLSYEWPQQWVTRWSGQATGAATRASATPPSDARVIPFTGALQPLLDSALARRHDWTIATLSLPTARDGELSATVSSGNTYRPDLRSMLSFDPSTGAITSSRDSRELPRARRVRNWLRFLHTGEVFGLPGQAIATLVSLGAAVLVFTGLALSLRRFARWRARGATA